jgi:hypothetical protein
MRGEAIHRTAGSISKKYKDFCLRMTQNDY